MKVLCIGSGGREHALVYSFARKGHQVFCAPGNPGIARLAECVEIDPADFAGLIAFARRHSVDLTVVGPEAPLVAGIADEFEKKGLVLFGPNAQAALLEGDKGFAKKLLKKYGIPTARFEVFDDFEKAVDYVKRGGFPVVVKACGLALGKGVKVCENEEEAIGFLTILMREGRLGEAGSRVVIEEFLSGEEASIIALCDGERLLFLPPSQDHKRLLDNDEGPNTGGMGAYAPVPAVTPLVFDQIVRLIFVPLLDALKKEGIVYRGAIYAGLMLTPDGPKVLEFNCRFGDPEAQVILPIFDDDLAELCLACAHGRLGEDGARMPKPQKWALCVVAAAKGYPGTYEKGLPISGEVEGGESTIVFHAGTKMVEGKFFTSGGRVLGVTGIGKTLFEARERAYYGIGLIHFPGMHYRRDIGAKGLRYLQEER
ncbi:MAG: phosphoribosylamine--glycine ligase [candidate division WOR-3 bacterium]